MEWSQLTQYIEPVLQVLITAIAGYILKKAPEFTQKQFDNLEAKSQNEYWKRFLSTVETIVLAVEQTTIKEFKKANADRDVTKDEWAAIYKQAREEAEEQILKAIEAILPESLKPLARDMLPSLVEASVAKVKLTGDGVTVNPS